MNVAVTVKQVPAVDALLLGPTRRLRRDGIALEMSAYCRRAVAKGVELAHATGGRCTVLSLGPPSASDVLREALACGADDAVLLSDRRHAAGGVGSHGSHLQPNGVGRHRRQCSCCLRHDQLRDRRVREHG